MKALAVLLLLRSLAAAGIVHVSWQYDDNPHVPLQGFRVEWKVGETGVWVRESLTGPGERSCNVEMFSRQTRVFRVIAVAVEGLVESPPSEEVTFTAPAFPQPSPRRPWIDPITNQRIPPE